MTFWIGILVAAVSAWYAFKINFYETWALMFNILISVYLAVFLGPEIADAIPAAGDTPYGTAFCMIATAIGVFLILYGITFTFLTGQFKVSFPKVLNTLGTGFLGFLAGLLVWNFVSLLIYTTPISKNAFIKDIGFNAQSQQTNLSYISFWCDLVNKVVGTKDSYCTTEQAINKLTERTKKKIHPKTTPKVRPAEPNDTEVETKAADSTPVPIPADVNLNDL